MLDWPCWTAAYAGMIGDVLLVPQGTAYKACRPGQQPTARVPCEPGVAANVTGQDPWSIKVGGWLPDIHTAMNSTCHLNQILVGCNLLSWAVRLLWWQDVS